MARGRIISTQVASDDSLNKLSPDAERLYLRTLPHLDRDGLITGHPMLLWAKVAPLRMELMDQTNALIQEWVQQGLVVRYPGADGQPVLHFKGFRRHNANIPYTDEAPSIYPPPPGWYRGKTGLIPEDEDACFRLAQQFDSRSSYRKELEKALRGREEVATTSRGGREEVEYKHQDQVQDQDQCTDGDDQSLTTPHHVGYSNTPHYAKLAATFAETPDDELRLGIDAIAARYGLPDSFNGWTRAVAGWSRDELLLVLATLKTWETWDNRQFDRINSLPAFLRAAVKSATWPKLNRSQIAALADDVDDAVSLASLPAAEAAAEFAARQEERNLASRYSIQEDL